LIEWADRRASAWQVREVGGHKIIGYGTNGYGQLPV
jgi:hypothetical protein